MDFKIEIDHGLGRMTFEKDDTILNNIYLSLAVSQGSFFQNPEFGSRLHLLQRAKNTDTSSALAEDYCREALQWLLDIGKAKSIDISTERETPDRLKVLVEATQADERKVNFETFVEVV